MLYVIFLEMRYLRGEGQGMLRRFIALFLRIALVACVLAIPGLASAASSDAQCADNVDNGTVAAMPGSASAALQSKLVGAEAPDFTVKDSAGHEVHLRDLRGKVVVIDFWMSECPSSRAEMPYLQQMHDQYPDRDFAALGLNVGEDAAHVADFARGAAFTFPLLVGADPQIVAKYSVKIYPMAFVVDRGGKVVFAGSPAAQPGEMLRAVKSAVAKKN
jgi:peroxiredoxin